MSKNKGGREVRKPKQAKAPKEAPGESTDALKKAKSGTAGATRRAT